VAPTFVVAVRHLGLQEAPKLAIARPANAVSLLDAALDDGLFLNYDVYVDPHTVSEHFI